VRHLQVFREGRKTDPGCGGVRLLGFAPVCDPVRRCASVRSPNDASMGRSCLGLLVLFQGCRARFSRATAWARPRADHQPPAGSRRTHNLAAGQPIRSWALRTPPPRSSSRRRNVRRPRSSARRGPLAARAFVLPFSVFEGLMPGRPSRGLRTRVGRLPV